jgi:hypothetical protein
LPALVDNRKTMAKGKIPVFNNQQIT